VSTINRRHRSICDDAAFLKSAACAGAGRFGASQLVLAADVEIEIATDKPGRSSTRICTGILSSISAA